MMTSFGDSIHAQRPLRWLLDAGHEALFLDAVDPLPGGAPRYSFQRYPAHSGRKLLTCMLGRGYAKAAVGALHQERLKRIAGRFRPSLFHVHWIDGRAWDFANAGFRPLVLTAWGTDVNRLMLPEHNERLRAQVAFALRQADLVIADTRDIVDKCKAIANYELPHRLLLPGIDTSRYLADQQCRRRTMREQLGIPDDTFVFGSLRATAELYNHHLVLRAFAKARPLVGNSVLLMKIYNADKSDEYVNKIKKLASTLGIADHVKWLHDVTDHLLPYVYAAVDVVVNYPRMDAFPVHFLEAAAAGRRIISCGLPAYELLFRYASPLFVAPDDVEVLAESLGVCYRERLLSRTRDDLLKLQDHVTRAYDEETTGRELLNCYSLLTRESVKLPKAG